MVKKLLTVFMLGATAMSANAQQLANGSFESDWVDCFPWEKGIFVTTAFGSQPEGWCVSNVPNSLAKSMGSQVEGYEGKAAKIANTSAMGNGIPGYMTLGTSWATAETRMTSTRNKDGGVFGGIAFTYRPDAINFMYQRDANGKTDVSTVVAYSWKGTWTQASVPSNTAVGVFNWGSATKVTMTDRDVNILGREYATGGAVTKTEDAELVASVIQKITGTTSDWTNMEVALDYKTTSVVPDKFNLVFAAAGYLDDGGPINDGVSLTIDEVKLVYWNTLSSLNYDGVELLEGENTNYEVNKVYDAAKLTAETKSVFATATTSFNEATHIATVTVTRENTKDKVYTIQFADASAEPTVVDNKIYTAPLYVIVNGEFSTPQDADVLVETLDNGNINFILKNFVLGSGDEAIPVGNIAVKNLEVTDDDTFAFNDILNIEAGDAEGYDYWLGPMLGEIPLAMNGKFADDKVFVDIDIDMMNSIGQIIKVHLGDDYIPATLAVNAEAKYGTFCAPFDVAVPDGVEASTASLNGQMIELTSVGETIPANTPVVLNAEDGLDAKTVYGKAVAGSTSSGCLTGVLAATTISQGYVLQNHSGKVGFYELTSSKVIPANRAYLTAPAGARFFGFDDETSISSINVNANANTAIYNLAGQRVSKAEKGIFIINGKKVVK